MFNCTADCSDPMITVPSGSQVRFLDREGMGDMGRIFPHPVPDVALGNGSGSRLTLDTALLGCASLSALGKLGFNWT